MKKILIAFTPLVIIFGGCTKNLTDLNVNPKAPPTVPSYTLFTNAEKTLADNITTPNVNVGIFELIAQYWQETTYTDESRYDLSTRSIPQNWWAALYRDVLKDFDEAKKLIPTDVSDPDVQKNQLAIADIIEVYTWYILVNTFGDIPYSEALDINNPFPKYDDASTIYSDLLSRIDADIASLNPDATSFDQADLIYSGDVSLWLKFANSFKLKMGMLIADIDPATAKSVVESAATGVFESNDDNAIFQYLSAPPNTNPIWTNLVQSGRKDFVACTTTIDEMTSVNDPRLPFYFTEDATGGYSGGEPGVSSNYATFSKPSGPLVVPGSIGKVTNPDFPADLLDYAEVEFLLAEAVERGMNVGGTAEEHYDNAITASIEYWGGSAADAATYLSNPAINYKTGTWKERIGTQEWVALYTRGFDGWTIFRRLRYPALQAPSTALSEFPVRYTYPVNEQNLNQTNYDAASAAIGGDVVTTKLWWDVN